MGVYAQTYAQIDAKNMFSAEIWVDTRRYSVIIVKETVSYGYIWISASIYMYTCP